MHRIHGTAGSPFVRKVRAAFGEKGLASELVAMDVFNPPPEFARISPLRRIPVLELADGSGREPLADSSAICAYLEALQPEPPLYPADPYLRGRAVWLEEYADTVLAYQLGMGVMRPLLAAARTTADDARMADTLANRLPPLFGYLEQALGGREWFVGDGFSIADLSVAAQLSGLILVDRWDILGEHPGLAGLLRRSRERPAFAAAVDEALVSRSSTA